MDNFLTIPYFSISFDIFDTSHNYDDLTMTMIILETCGLWDIDYNSNNWEPELMRIFVTWQSTVTLDEFHNKISSSSISSLTRVTSVKQVSSLTRVTLVKSVLTGGRLFGETPEIHSKWGGRLLSAATLLKCICRILWSDLRSFVQHCNCSHKPLPMHTRRGVL